MVLWSGQPKLLKNCWFYRPGHRFLLKKRWFYFKTRLCHRRPGPCHGSGVCSSNTRLGNIMRNPLQTSCLGNHWFYRWCNRFCCKTVASTESIRENDKKVLVLQTGQPKLLKNLWFYSIRAEKYQKSNGFANRATEIVEKPLVLQYPSGKVAKRQWFYRPGNRNCWKTVGFTLSVRKSCKKALVL